MARERKAPIFSLSCATRTTTTPAEYKKTGLVSQGMTEKPGEFSN